MAGKVRMSRRSEVLDMGSIQQNCILCCHDGVSWLCPLPATDNYGFGSNVWHALFNNDLKAESTVLMETCMLWIVLAANGDRRCRKRCWSFLHFRAEPRKLTFLPREHTHDYRRWNEWRLCSALAQLSQNGCYAALMLMWVACTLSRLRYVNSVKLDDTKTWGVAHDQHRMKWPCTTD